MSVKQMRQCDVFPPKEAEFYEIDIYAGASQSEEATVVETWTADLSERGLARLRAKIEQGLKPPKKRTPKAG